MQLFKWALFGEIWLPGFHVDMPINNRTKELEKRRVFLKTGCLNFEAFIIKLIEIGRGFLVLHFLLLLATFLTIGDCSKTVISAFCRSG